MEKINIPTDKEEIIYKAALNEFAKNGYIKASTNEIVKNCGISKGSLFNYFGNKKNLYFYIVYTAFKKVEQIQNLEYDKGLPSDFFERLQVFVKLKFILTLEYVDESKIILESFVDFNEEFMELLGEEYIKHLETHEKVCTENIDLSKFKEGIDIKKAYEMVMILSEGFLSRLMKVYANRSEEFLKDSDKLFEELNGYLDILKLGLYK
ncbi:MAG: TetR/AcrR family transcriptional regulator [Clostridium sp.]